MINLLATGEYHFVHNCECDEPPKSKKVPRKQNNGNWTLGLTRRAHIQFIHRSVWKTARLSDQVKFLFWAGHWKIDTMDVYDEVTGEMKHFLRYKEDFLKYIFSGSYNTTHGGFVKTTVDAPCPTEVGDNNWTDYFGKVFNSPSGIVVRACLENKGAQGAPHALSHLPHVIRREKNRNHK